MSPPRRATLLPLAAALLILLVALVIAFATRESRTLTYTLVFHDAQGLRPGDPVVMSGITIGTVKHLTLAQDGSGKVNVLVRIDPEHAQAVRADSTAMITEAPAGTGPHRMQLEIVNAANAPNAPPMTPKSVVKGLAGPLELELWHFRQKLRSGGDHLSSVMDALAENLQQLDSTLERIINNSPQVQHTLNDLRDFVRRMHEEGRRNSRDLARQWPDLRERVQRQWMNLGPTAGAKPSPKSAGSSTRSTAPWRSGNARRRQPQPRQPRRRFDRKVLSKINAGRVPVIYFNDYSYNPIKILRE